MLQSVIDNPLNFCNSDKGGQRTPKLSVKKNIIDQITKKKEFKRIITELYRQFQSLATLVCFTCSGQQLDLHHQQEAVRIEQIQPTPQQSRNKARIF